MVQSLERYFGQSVLKLFKFVFQMWLWTKHSSYEIPKMPLMILLDLPWVLVPWSLLNYCIYDVLFAIKAVCWFCWRHNYANINKFHLLNFVCIPVVIDEDEDLLPVLLEEFPHLYMSEHTWHELWRRGIGQIENLTRAYEESKRRKSKAQLQVGPNNFCITFYIMCCCNLDALNSGV